MTRGAKVSAVIPTRNRPDLVLRAVRSALAQEYTDMEVIVVIDGPDARTATMLNEIEDRRLQVIALPEAASAANARNAGVANASGDWIAFLDDNDEWLPEKIVFQMERATSSSFLYPIVSCQVFARTNSYQVVWPRRRPYEPLCNYLLARNSWSYGDGLLSTTTLLFPKDLFLQQPFRSSLRRHQDLDWVLRAAKCAGAGIEFVAKPLAVWDQQEGRSSISTTADWRLSLEWVESVRHMITGRAYASFLATHIAPQAARQRDWKAFIILLKKMVMLGKPCARQVGNHMTQITVGIPVFNAMPYLPEALESILRQSYTDFTILAINDGSSDGSLEYLQSIRDPRLRILSQQNQGLTSIFNRMLFEVKTPWLVRFDSDDVAYPHRLALTIEYIARYPRSGMMYSMAEYYPKKSVANLERPRVVLPISAHSCNPGTCHRYATRP